MTCSACSARVEKCILTLDGVSSASVNLLTGTAVAEYDEKKLSSEGIILAIEKAGYGASTAEEKAAVSGSKSTKSAESESFSVKTRLIVSFAFMLPLMYVSMGHMIGLPLPAFLAGHANAVSFAFTQLLLCLPAVFVNFKFFRNGYSSLFHGAPNMDTLIAVGSSASLLYGVFAIYRMSYGLGVGDMELVAKYHENLYFESAVMILTLITLGKFIEEKSKKKTGAALKKLMDMSPKTATVIRDGVETDIPVEDVRVGDIFAVKPGAAVPADGIVTEGFTDIDESAITGESMPVHKAVGSEITAATVNKTGYIKARAVRVGENTAFANIIRLVEDASATKAPISRLADKISGIFVPTVMAISLVTFVVWMLIGNGFEFALTNAVSVLVISCPCALGLATPVAIMAGTGKGAENGILIKSGEALETAKNITTVVLDKTGTLTEGKPKVTDIIPIGADEKELLSLALALEKRSEHPLALAIVERASGAARLEIEDFQAIPGKGVFANIGGVPCLAGNERLMSEHGVDIGKNEEALRSLAESGKTPLMFSKGGRLCGIIAAADAPKETSLEAINELKALGTEIIMLTGDNARTANGIAKELGIDRVFAELLPQDKERAISELRREGKCVAMVGDGINDAPALVSADVGIAIGAGTDVALESADIVLIKSDLRDVATAIKLSRAVIRNIKQNLFWAFFYNCLGIPLAAGAFYFALSWQLSPMFGAAAMSCSSIFVVTNALRLRHFGKIKTSKKENKKGEKEEMVIKIKGMMCMHCVSHVEKALAALDGVTEVKVSLEKGTATVSGTASAEALKKAITDAGYEVVSIG